MFKIKRITKIVIDVNTSPKNILIPFDHEPIGEVNFPNVILGETGNAFSERKSS